MSKFEEEINTERSYIASLVKESNERIFNLIKEEYKAIKENVSNLLDIRYSTEWQSGDEGSSYLSCSVYADFKLTQEQFDNEDLPYYDSDHDELIATFDYDDHFCNDLVEVKIITQEQFDRINDFMGWIQYLIEDLDDLQDYDSFNDLIVEGE